MFTYFSMCTKARGNCFFLSTTSSGDPPPACRKWNCFMSYTSTSSVQYFVVSKLFGLYNKSGNSRAAWIVPERKSLSGQPKHSKMKAQRCARQWIYVSGRTKLFQYLLLVWIVLNTYVAKVFIIVWSCTLADTPKMYQLFLLYSTNVQHLSSKRSGWSFRSR